MLYRQLGKSSLEVSVLGLGTWQFGGNWGKVFTQPEVNDIFACASDNGINFLDTAECYGHHTSEMFIGKALEGRRDKWVIATKFGHNRGNDLDPEENWKAKQVEVQLEESLKALKTDYIDVYQFHSGTNQQFDNDELWTLLDKKKQQGLIREIGVSIGHFDNVHQVAGMESIGATVLQLVYNPIKRGAERRVFDLALKQNLGVIVRVPLASGFMSGKYPIGSRWGDNDVRSHRKGEVLDQELKAAQNLLKAKPDGLSPAAWTIAWGLKNPAVHTSIPGVKSVAQLEENLQAVELLPG